MHCCIRWYGCIAAILATASFAALAAGNVRRHDAHVHGEGRLNVVVEGDRLVLELISPAVNIVGFEHEPGNAEQQKIVEDAVAALKAGSGIIAPAPDADCRLSAAEVATSLLHEADEKHQAHAEEHTEFHAAYEFHCGAADRLSHIDVLLFETFPGSERLDAQVIGPNGQTAVELTAASSRLNF